MAEPLTLQLPISGMTCASCVARVEKAIAKVPGEQAFTTVAESKCSLLKK